MELDGQNAMLERLCRKHGMVWEDDDNVMIGGAVRTMVALRELLLAVQAETR